MKLISRGLGALAVSALALSLLTPAAANAAVSTISGSASCPAGSTFYVSAHAHSGTITFWINGKSKSVGGRDSLYKSGLRSGTWKVTGPDLAYASSACSGGFGGGGGNFSLPANVINE